MCDISVMPKMCVWPKKYAFTCFRGNTTLRNADVSVRAVELAERVGMMMGHDQRGLVGPGVEGFGQPRQLRLAELARANLGFDRRIQQEPVGLRRFPKRHEFARRLLLSAIGSNFMLGKRR